VSGPERDTLRLDKWLWHARFYKTRTLATDMVTRGKVRVNGSRVTKPALAVGAGDTLTLVQGREVRVVRITGLPQRRGPASEAQNFYDDIAPPKS
jgi:ribosome-associated heat shock protein Hsp15